MGYYLIITFIIFIFVDYKYIYSFIDSKFLYKSSGSKLNLEANKFQKLKFLNISDKLDICICVTTFLIIFSINYLISSIAFNTNPLVITIIKPINIRVILSDYEAKFKTIYYLTSALSIFFLLNNYIKEIRKIFLRCLKNNLKTSKPKEEVEGLILAKDENDECFVIPEDAMYQNVLITGSIGTGKTSGAISRITSGLIKSGKSGIVLDAKGNFVDSVETMCKTHGRTKDLIVISKNSPYYFELLDSTINPLELANRLKQVITLLSTNNNSDSYWLDKVENVIMNLLVIMKYLDRTDIMMLHRLVTEDSFLKATINNIKIESIKNVPDDKTAFELVNAMGFVENEYFKLDSKVSTIIKSEITRLTIPLITNYDVYNQFCVQKEKQKISFGDGKIIVLSINIGENRALCKIISTFLKLSYQKYILSNMSNNKPNFFIADEFQEFCNSEDAHFLSLAREAKCANIISTQSYTSLKNTLKDENAANVIIQNLVNKIWFRNDDNYTISEAVKQLGKANVIKENKTISEAGQESRKNIFKEGFINKKSSISKSLNYVTVKENEYDENFFSRELKVFEAFVFLSTKGGIITKKVIFERWNKNE